VVAKFAACAGSEDRLADRCRYPTTIWRKLLASSGRSLPQSDGSAADELLPA
jgi:hypothetical protein